MLRDAGERVDVLAEPFQVVVGALRLHTAGWSIGDAGFGDRWLVCGTHGEQRPQSLWLPASPAEGYALELEME
jgi:hypothetical protein